MAVFGQRTVAISFSSLFATLLPAFCTVLWSNCRAAEQVTIYGDDDYAPYSYIENGQFKGMYVDIMREVAKQMLPAYQITIQPIPWKRGLAELEAGTSFALFPPGIKKERDYIEPYSVPLYRETVVLFCNDQVMSRPHNNFPDDFVGLTIGVNLGFLLSDRLIQARDQGKVILEAAKGNDTNLKKLAGQHIDCYASDRTAARYSMKHLADAVSSSFVLREAIELSGENTFVAYSRNNNPHYKSNFVTRLNSVLQTMQSNGAISRIESGYLR